MFRKSRVVLVTSTRNEHEHLPFALWLYLNQDTLFF